MTELDPQTLEVTLTLLKRSNILYKRIFFRQTKVMVNTPNFCKMRPRDLRRTPSRTGQPNWMVDTAPRWILTILHLESPITRPCPSWYGIMPERCPGETLVQRRFVSEPTRFHPELWCVSKGNFKRWNRKHDIVTMKSWWFQVSGFL